MVENLLQAGRAAERSKDLLRAALASAGAVESIALLDLIAAAASLEQKVQALRAALAEDQRAAPRIGGRQQLELKLPWPAQTFGMAS